MRINLLILFFFLSIIPLKSQTVELSAVGYSIISGITIGYQMADRTAYAKGDPIYIKHQKIWRATLPLEMFAAMSTGFFIALDNKNDWLGISVDVLEVFAIRENIRPIVYNITRNQYVFKQPNTKFTYFSGVETFSTVFIRFAFLSVVVSFKYLILPLIQ
jgi:hypothetical protein